MWSAPRSLALFAVLVAFLAPATAGVAASPAPMGTASVPASAPVDTAGQTPPAAVRPPVGQPRLSDPVNTTIRVELYANASARWSVVTTYELESDEERAVFAQYAEEYRTGETDAGPSVDTFRALAESASVATDREMRIRNVSRSATVSDEYGSVGVSFRWTSMLERTGNRTLRLDDAVLLAANRTWLSTIEADQRLVIVTPEGYSIVDSDGPSFDLRNNAVVVEGPRTLESPLSVTYRRSTTTTSPPTDGSGQIPIVAGTVLLLVALLAGVHFWRRGGAPAPASSDDGSDGGSTAATDADHEASSVSTPGESPGTGSEPAGSEPVGSEPVDLELLSDEERVEHLLEQNDGRMKQANIVSETGWSDAKVSQLLSSMADEGRIEKLRLGRENLISLPDEDPGENG